MRSSPRNGAFITSCVCHGCPWPTVTTGISGDAKTSYQHYAAWHGARRRQAQDKALGKAHDKALGKVQDKAQARAAHHGRAPSAGDATTGLASLAGQ